VCEKQVAACQLDDATQIHDRDTITDMADHPEVVGNENISQVELILQLNEQIEDLSLDRHIQGRRRFIRNDQLGMQS